ncbi:hypothetical protein [Desulfovibrio inopinatus]|uniref:hypothetical protein n=1 Tax=Desulfovibrio inopinatus TaxID=102109 RepID=UPI0004241A33|nr:hypothetical protein [Desulfovibrio inopinatus]
MSIWTESELRELIALYKTAYRQAVTGLEIEVGDERIKRMSPAEIKAALDGFEAELDTVLSTSAPRIVAMRPSRGAW